MGPMSIRARRLMQLSVLAGIRSSEPAAITWTSTVMKHRAQNYSALPCEHGFNPSAISLRCAFVVVVILKCPRETRMEG
jgi:hypothetical protein